MPVNVQFLTSAVEPDQYPKGDRPEVVVLGRSNAGKSSLLNAMSGRKIAYVSSSPGKTNLLNFFNFGEHYRWVDVPGYGFSKRPGEEQRSWKNMIETYLISRTTLAGILLVVDSRRGWSEDEDELIAWLRPMMIPWALVLTKADKLNQKERRESIAKAQAQSGVESIFLISSLKNEGVDDLENFVFKSWIEK